MHLVRRKEIRSILVHNVRRGGKVRQLHLARLATARELRAGCKLVAKKHPFVELNWRHARAR